MDSDIDEQTPLRPVSNKQDLSTKFKDPTSIQHKIIVLILMCFLSLGSYFCFDNPTALHSQFIHDLNIDEATYMQLYSWYSWPNVVLCFFGGFLTDRVLGVRKASIIFCFLLIIGQLVFAAGAYFNKPAIMFFGRFIFGIGGESLAVAQNTYTVRWFSGNSLNFVFGLQLSMARIGSTINMNIMIPIYNSLSNVLTHPLAFSLLIGVLVCLFSFLCAVILGWLDLRAERIKRNRQNEDVDLEIEEEPVIKFSDVKHFNLQLWLLCIICVAYYVAIFPFIGLATVFFEEKFDFLPGQASAVNSIVYLLSAPLSPLIGFFVGILGHHIYWVIASVTLGMFSHLILNFTFFNPWFAMVAIAVSYSAVACSLWPIVSFIVPKHQISTAYGLMSSIQNLGLASISQLAGLILDKNGLFILELFFTSFLSIALVTSILLFVVDYHKKSYLNISARKRNQLEKNIKSETAVEK